MIDIISEEIILFLNIRGTILNLICPGARGYGG